MGYRPTGASGAKAPQLTTECRERFVTDLLSEACSPWPLLYRDNTTPERYAALDVLFEDGFDLRRQFLLGGGAGMVPAHDPLAIQQDQCGRGGIGAVTVEIRIAERNWHAGEQSVIFAANHVDV